MQLIAISEEDLKNYLSKAWTEGFNTYEMVEAGLETRDPDGYARWILSKIKNDTIINEKSDREFDESLSGRH